MKSILLLQTSLLLTIPSLATCQSGSGKTYETHTSRRERNLDHWDAETLSAYLGLDPDTAQPLDPDTYVGIDAAIMFYAQWCNNCHKFAPVWDTIGQIVHAGTADSNLIMALFNCELDSQHTKLCTAAGVTHYPTLMYAGAGPYADKDPISKAVLGKKASGPYGETTLPRTVKFQGNLNVGDSVLDWVKAMRGLSTWYKWNYIEGGWLRGVRNFFNNPLKRKKVDSSTQNALPVGVPGIAASGSVAKRVAGSASTASTAKLEKDLKLADLEIERATKQVEEQKLAANHAAFMIDAYLFPVMKNGTDALGNVVKTPADVFEAMEEAKAWDLPIVGNTNATKSTTADEDAIVLKSCVVDLTLDYCTRYSSKATTDYLDSINDLPNDEYPSFTTMEGELKVWIKENEPYCSKFNDCYMSDFSEADGCRPTTCPFKNEPACGYVSGCLSSHVQGEYKEYLNKETAKSDDTAKATTA